MDVALVPIAKYCLHSSASAGRVSAPHGGSSRSRHRPRLPRPPASHPHVVVPHPAIGRFPQVG